MATISGAVVFLAAGIVSVTHAAHDRVERSGRAMMPRLHLTTVEYPVIIGGGGFSNAWRTWRLSENVEIAPPAEVICEAFKFGDQVLQVCHLEQIQED